MELAAARAKALAPGQILERLGQRLDLLRGGRDADPRQQTLRATIEWSYDLLSEDERLLFRRLSVFADGCSLDAAEEVCDADLDTLQSLVEKSLVRFTRERYWMLETIGEYAGERLDPTEAAPLRRRHRAWMVALAEASARDLHSAQESAVSARLAPDYANVRAAVGYALDARQPDDVARILGAIYPFLISHGHLGEAREWAEATLAARDELSERGSGRGARRRRRDRALRRRPRPRDRAEGGARVGPGPAPAAELAGGDAGRPGRDRARPGRLRRRPPLRRGGAAAGAEPRAALCFAELALRDGDLGEAATQGRAALAGFDEGSFNHACALEILGEIARRSGDMDEAGVHFEEALRSFTALGDGGGVADALDGLARLAPAGDPERAGRLLGAAERLRETRGRRAARTDEPPPDAPRRRARGGPGARLRRGSRLRARRDGLTADQRLEESADDGTVDLRCERKGSGERAWLSQPRTVDGRTQEQLADAAPGRDRLQLVEPEGGRLGTVVDGDGAECVESVSLDPEVRIRQASAELGRVDEQLERAGDVPARLGDEPEAAQRDALPARIADLAAEREGVLEALLGRVEVAEHEVELAAERLGPRDERGHPANVGLVERLVEKVERVLDLAAHQVEAAEERERLAERLGAPSR